MSKPRGGEIRVAVPEDIPNKFIDELVGEEFEDVRRKQEEEKLRTMTLDNESREQNMKERQRFAWSLFELMLFTMVGVGLLLVWSALPNANRLELSTEVQIALVAGVTIKIIGLFYTVTKYLFSEKQHERAA